MRFVAALLIAACTAEGAEPSSAAASVEAKSEVEEKVVDLGDAPLEGAESSLDALGRAIVDALNANDRTALLGLALSPTEYKVRLFDALVQHPNAYKMGPDLLWDMHAAESNGDLSQALSRFGKRNLAFASIAVDRTEERKGGLVFHKRPTILAKDADGNEVKLRLVGTIVEHPASGSFKILGFKNDD